MLEALSWKKKKQNPRKWDVTFKFRLKYIMVASLKAASLKARSLQTGRSGL